MIEIDYTLLTDLVFDRLLTEHVLHEATDYGKVELPFEDKKQQLFAVPAAREV